MITLINSSSSVSSISLSLLIGPESSYFYSLLPNLLQLQQNLYKTNIGLSTNISVLKRIVTSPVRRVDSNGPHSRTVPWTLNHQMCVRSRQFPPCRRRCIYMVLCNRLSTNGSATNYSHSQCLGPHYPFEASKQWYRLLACWFRHHLLHPLARFSPLKIFHKSAVLVE